MQGQCHTTLFALVQGIRTFQSIVSAEKVLRTDFIPVYTLAATAAAEKLREIIALYAMYTASVTGSLRVVFVFPVSVGSASFVYMCMGQFCYQRKKRCPDRFTIIVSVRVVLRLACRQLCVSFGDGKTFSVETKLETFCVETKLETFCVETKLETFCVETKLETFCVETKLETFCVETKLETFCLETS